MEKKDIKKLKEVVARFNSNWRYKELLTYIDGLLDKAREEGYKKGYIDGQIEKINKPKTVVS